MTKTAVFTTSDILSYTETVKGFNVDPPFKVIADHGVLGEHSYSSFGALEKALAEGYKVYVVTSRAELGPQDEWWSEFMSGWWLAWIVGKTFGISMNAASLLCFCIYASTLCGPFLALIIYMHQQKTNT